MGHVWWLTGVWFGLLFALGVAGIIIAAVSGSLTDQTGLANEPEFVFTLSLWLLIWGILAVVVAVLFVLYWRCSGPSRRNLFFGASFILVSGPWLLIGQIFLLRKFTTTGFAAKDWVYYFSLWFALIASYVNVVVSAWNVRGGMDMMETTTHEAMPIIIGESERTTQSKTKYRYQ